MTGQKYGIYSEFTPSEGGWLGDIPAHWSANKLKFLASTFASNVDKKTKNGELPIQLCNYTDVYYNDVVSFDLPFMKATATREQIEKFTLRAGDTIITKDSEDPNDIAVPAFVEQDMPGVICGYHLSMIRPTPIMSPGFLNKTFQCAFARAYFATRSNGLTRYGLGGQALGSVVFPVPPLEEQTQIANFLDYETAKIDALIEKQQQLIALLKEKRQAVISHAVTKGLNPDSPMRDSGVEWLGEVPEHWELKQIRHITSQLGGGTPSKDNASFWDGDIPWVSPKDMKVDYISDSQDRVTEAAVVHSATKLIPVGSVLIVVRGMILDHSVPTALTTETVTINQDMKALMPYRDLGGEFLLFVLKGLRDYLLSHTDSSAHGTKCLATERLERTSIAVPGLDEQKDLVRGLKERVARIDSLSESANDVSTLLQERRTALISAAVTGKIDVREWKSPDDN